MSEVDLADMRRHYRAARVDSEEQAQRLISFGVGGAAAIMLMTAPALGPLLQLVWFGLCGAVVLGGLVARRHFQDRLRETVFDQQLQLHTRIDRDLWDRIGRMRELPQPLAQYAEHFLSTYAEFKRQVNEDTAVELGQAQLLSAREQVLDFLDLAERTGNIRRLLDMHGQRLGEEDQIRLREMFSEQCAGLQDLAQSFDRSLANLMMAQVLGDKLGETRIEDVKVRMREIEEEFDHVKQSLAAET